MAYERIRFTKSALSDLPIPAKGSGPRYYMDDAPGTPLGFGLWITPGGSRTFFVYRKLSGRPERIKIGRFPDLSIPQARKLAARVNGQIADGINPAQQKRSARGELTLGQLFQEYLDRHAIPQGRKSVSSMQADFTRYLGALEDAPRKPHGRKRTKPAGAVNWDRRFVSALSRSEVQRWHTALGRSCGKYASNRALQLLRAIINFGLKTHLLDRKRLENAENPAQGVALFRERQRDRFLVADELPKFFDSLSVEPNVTIRDFVLVSLLTGARKSNVLSMRWSDVNLDTRIWRIPETKNGDSLTIPLTQEVCAILLQRQTGNESEFVFPGESSSGHLVSPKNGWRRVLDRAGLKDLRLHDLRRTLGSWQAASGASLPIIGKSLGHRDVSTTAIYARLDLDPVRASLERATERMLVAMNRISDSRDELKGTPDAEPKPSGPA